MNEALIADPVRSRQILERIPAQRWGTPTDFEGAIVYLASKASDYVSGECLVVDGGWMGSESSFSLLGFHVGSEKHRSRADLISRITDCSRNHFVLLGPLSAHAYCEGSYVTGLACRYVEI